jgi:hypothetical protein
MKMAFLSKTLKSSFLIWTRGTLFWWGDLFRSYLILLWVVLVYLGSCTPTCFIPLLAQATSPRDRLRGRCAFAIFNFRTISCLVVGKALILTIESKNYKHENTGACLLLLRQKRPVEFVLLTCVSQQDRADEVNRVTVFFRKFHGVLFSILKSKFDVHLHLQLCTST